MTNSLKSWLKHSDAESFSSFNPNFFPKNIVTSNTRQFFIFFSKKKFRRGERKPTDPEERLNEEEVHVLESFLEEAHANGTGKLYRFVKATKKQCLL